MEDKQRCKTGNEEQEMGDFDDIADRKTREVVSFPFPSSIYGRSKAEKYLSCDHKDEEYTIQGEDLNTEKQAREDPHDSGRSRLTAEAHHAVNSSVRTQDEVAALEQCLHPSGDISTTISQPNRAEQELSSEIEPCVLLGQPGASFQETGNDEENRVFSLKTISKKLKIKNPWQRIKDKNKGRGSKAGGASENFVNVPEVQRISKDGKTADFISKIISKKTEVMYISSPKVDNLVKENTTDGTVSGSLFRDGSKIQPYHTTSPQSKDPVAEDLWMFLLNTERARTDEGPATQALVMEVHPFAIQEDVPLDGCRLRRMTYLLEDDADSSCERIKHISRRGKPKTPELPVVKEHISAPVSGHHKECYWSVGDCDKSTDEGPGISTQGKGTEQTKVQSIGRDGCELGNVNEERSKMNLTRSELGKEKTK